MLCLFCSSILNVVVRDIVFNQRGASQKYAEMTQVGFFVLECFEMRIQIKIK